MQQIKEIVKITGLSRRTLQFYDEIGLLEPMRTADNYRMYRKDDIKKLWKIIVYKEIGLKLSDIRHILHGHIKEQDMLEEKLQDINAEISTLKQKISFIEKVMSKGIPNPDENNEMPYNEQAYELLRKA